MCGAYLIIFYLGAMCYTYIHTCQYRCVCQNSDSQLSSTDSLPYYFVLLFETNPLCVALTAWNSLWKQGWPPAQRGSSTLASLHSSALASNFMYKTGSLTEPETVLIQLCQLKKSVVSILKLLSHVGVKATLYMVAGFLHGFGGIQTQVLKPLSQYFTDFSGPNFFYSSF